MIAALSDHVLFQSRLRPGALAVHGPAGPVSYRALAHDVAALATELMERNLTRADVIGLHLGFSYLHVLAILALDRLGIPSMSFATAERAAAPLTLLPQFGLTAVISGDGAPADVGCRWITIGEPDRPKLGRPDVARLAALDSPADALVRLSWSSGTTGGLKGSPLLRRIQAERLANRRLIRGMGPRTRYFTGMPLASATGYAMTLATLSAGGAVILPDPTTDFVTLANAFGVTLASGPPGLLSELTTARGGRENRLEAMEFLEILGAHLPSGLARTALAQVTPNLWSVYGSTETDRVATTEVPASLDDPSMVGLVVPWVEVEIVDPDGRTLPRGRDGELRVRGAQVIAGYYKDDAATRRNFRDGWFYPGDLGMLTDDGRLRVTGRVEDVIVRDGVAVSALPIEEAMRGVAGVRDVAVFPLGTPDGAAQICAALVVETGVDVARIRADAAARLGAEAPTRFFGIDRIPRNANGKVLRRELVDWAQRSAKP